MPELATKVNQPSPAPDVLNLPPKIPQVPDEVLKRFPGMEDYQRQMNSWWEKCFNILSDNNEDVSTVSNTNASGLINMRVTINGVSASIIEEAIIRADHDGNLAGKYTLTVTAGNVVTGMNITSATGPGTNISDVTFVATNFKIYNGVTGINMFTVSAGLVNLAGTLTVSTNGKVYIGAGNYGNADTAFYVDSSGNLSLKDKLTWDGSTLTINGVINSTSGSIGGFALDTNRFYSTVGTVRVEMSSSGGYLAMKDSGGGVLSEMGGYFFDIYNFYTPGQDAVKLESYITGGGYGRILLYDTGGGLKVALNTGGGGFGYFAGNFQVNGSVSFVGGGITMDTAFTWTYIQIPAAQTGRIQFGGPDNYIEEYYGIRLISQGATWPIRIVNGGLMINGGNDLGSGYFNAGAIYWSSSVYLYESGGYLYVSDANGDRPIPP